VSTLFVLTTYVDQVFPEIQYFFKSGLHQHAVYALLKEAPSPKEIASMHMTQSPERPDQHRLSVEFSIGYVALWFSDGNVPMP